jgi:hypothetical protein
MKLLGKVGNTGPRAQSFQPKITDFFTDFQISKNAD